MRKVVLYGAGMTSKNVIKMLNPSKCDLVAIVDRNYGMEYVVPDKGLWWDVPVSWGSVIKSPESLETLDFDYVLICSDLYLGEIKKDIIERGIPEKKIINASNNDFEFHYRNFYASMMYERNVSHSHKILVELTDCEVYDHCVCRELMLRRNRRIEDFQLKISDDYVRLSTIELIAERIKNLGISGAVAEAGVYKGDTAKYLNEIFSERKLYLFDTFDSFNNDVMSQEKGWEVSQSFKDAFKDTSIELVMSKMKYPKNCIVKKGVFPDTTEGLQEEKWAFVSLDMDLYESTYQGLAYFYPRMQKNGYIIIHDCLHHQEDKGNAMPAGKAVDQFCRERGINYVPVTDVYGSVVITK